MAWTEEEMVILREHYRATPKEQLLSLLPNKKWGAVVACANKNLGLRRDGLKHYWTATELAILKDHYYRSPKELILSLLPNKTWINVRVKAKRIRVFRPSTVWTDSENNILKEHYQKTTKENLMRLLPNRTWIAVYTQAERELHLSRSLTIHATSKMQTLNLTEWQRGYIAGLIDGEGSFLAVPHINKNSFAFEIQISNTNLLALQEIQKFVGFGKVYYDTKSPNTDFWLTRKVGYKYRIYKISEILPLIEQIKPYLFIKRKHADVLERMIKEIVKNKLEHGKRNGYIHKQSTWKLFDELKALNMRGISDEERGDRVMKAEEFKKLPEVET